MNIDKEVYSDILELITTSTTSFVTGNMHIENRNFKWTLMPLFLAGVLSNTWKVEYHQQRICAVSGSSVLIPCSFYYPDNLKVVRHMWAPLRSNHDRKLNTRFQYIGDKKHNCSLKIHQVEHNDAGRYAFRFVTNSKDGRWTGRNGSTLTVVDLSISVVKPDGYGAAMEGDSVDLSCSNGCDEGNPVTAFTWFKNGEPINEGSVLHLSNVSSTNSGNYTCSLKTHTETTSGVININVEYGPKNTSVSVRPSLDVDASSSNVTLICSSHANPPVENYTWYKLDGGGGGGDIMDVGHQSVFFPGDGGQYLCSATSKHGSQNSSVVTLMIKPYWATFTRDVFIAAVVALLLIGISIIIITTKLCKKHKWTPQADNEDTQNTDYVNWLTCDNNQSQERNQCDGETSEVIYTSVDFSNNRKTNMEQQMSAHTDDEDVIYITVYTGNNG